MRNLFRLLAVLLLVGLGVVAYQALRPAPVVAPVPVSSADLSSADRKATSLAEAVAGVQRTGRPVAVDVTFTDAELTALAAEHAGDQQTLDSIVLHSSSQGYVEGNARAHLAGQAFPAYFRAHLLVEGGRPHLDVFDVRVASLGVPQTVVDQLARSLSTPIDLGGGVQVQDARVVYGDGHLRITGTLAPA